MAKKKSKKKEVIQPDEGNTFSPEETIDHIVDADSETGRAILDEDGTLEPVEDQGLPLEVKEEIKQPIKKAKRIVNMEDARAKTIKVYTFRKPGMTINVKGQDYTSDDLNEKTVNTLRNLIPNFDALIK